MKNLTAADWVGIYGAALSTLLAIVGGIVFCCSHWRVKREKAKLMTSLEFLKKKDRSTGEVHPVVVVLLANLGTERISIKSLEYRGIAGAGGEMVGSAGWYEEPEAAYGIMKRLLPLVLESGQVARLPMLGIGLFTRTTGVKIWLTEFDDRRYDIAPESIESVKREIEKYQKESPRHAQS